MKTEGNDISEAKKKLAEATEKVRLAEEVARNAKAAWEQACKELGELRKELHEARIAADMELPKCRLIFSNFYGKPSVEKGVIVGRTEKTIKARAIGGHDDDVRRFRESKYGDWIEYGATGRLCRIEFDEQEIGK